jgi:hypothetical protein
MKLWKVCVSGLLLLTGMTQLPLEGFAQEQPSNAPPNPAAKAIPPIGMGDEPETSQSPDALVPDDRPLTGFQQLTIGTPSERHSYWIPGISYINFIESNALTQGGANNWNSTSYVSGNLSLQENWRTAQLALSYSGGGSFSSGSSIGNGQFHQLGAVQAFNWRRWQLTILDQFTYLPESQFCFGPGTAIASPGACSTLPLGQPGLQGGFNPSQSIFTAVGPRYTNSFGTQVNYVLTPRGSITLGGVLGILRFTESGNIESNDLILNAGYDYKVSKTDIIGLSYRFSAYHYIGFPQAIGDHAFQAVYGKKITGRLALQLSGGPEIANFRVSPGVGNKTQYISGTGWAGLSYASLAGSLSLSYTHGINNGSGVFLGATTDQVTGSGTRKLSRVWRGNASLGYARNKSAAGSNGTQNQAYNNLYIGAGLQRPLSRSTIFTLNYTATIQTSNNAVCAGANCGTNFTTHLIIVGLSWHARPFVLH